MTATDALTFARHHHLFYNRAAPPHPPAILSSYVCVFLYANIAVAIISPTQLISQPNLALKPLLVCLEGDQKDFGALKAE